MRAWHFSENAYPYLPPEDDYESIRVSLPNRLYDPKKGAVLYDRYIDEWLIAEDEGVEIMLNEHHQTATCVDPAAPLVLDPSAFVHDPATGIATATYGPIPPSLLGAHLWFQGLIVDLAATTWPLPATNAPKRSTTTSTSAPATTQRPSSGPIGTIADVDSAAPVDVKFTVDVGGTPDAHGNAVA